MASLRPDQQQLGDVNQLPPAQQLAGNLQQAAQVAGANLGLLGGANPAPQQPTLRITISNGADCFTFHVPLSAVVLVQHLCQLARLPGAPRGASPTSSQPETPMARAPQPTQLSDTPSANMALAGAESRGRGALGRPPSRRPPRPPAPPGANPRPAWSYIVDVSGPVSLRLHVPATEAARQVRCYAVLCCVGGREGPGWVGLGRVLGPAAEK